MEQSDHFADFAPVTVQTAPSSYGGEMKAHGRWFLYPMAGYVWTDDGANLGLVVEASFPVDDDLVSRMLTALQDYFADGVSATEVFNVLMAEAAPGVWSEGPLDLLIS